MCHWNFHHDHTTDQLNHQPMDARHTWRVFAGNSGPKRVSYQRKHKGILLKSLLDVWEAVFCHSSSVFHVTFINTISRGKLDRGHRCHFDCDILGKPRSSSSRSTNYVHYIVYQSSHMPAERDQDDDGLMKHTFQKQRSKISLVLTKQHSFM